MNHPSGEICVCENWNSGPAMMSFVGLESNSEKHQFSWDWETNSPLIMATTNTNANGGGGGGGGFPGGEFASSVTVPSALHYSEIPAGLAGNRSGYGGFVKREEGFGDQSRNYQSGRIGLNLGHRTYFSSQDNPMINRLLRRSRGYLQPATQIPRCQAEGCKIDLSNAKHYHRRHKVCEFHSKAIRVITGGLEQRFCQQCSRFHVLAEFDEAKRSCRKRLADHNRRRRKPQPGAEASGAKSAENGPEKTRPTGVTSHVVSVSSSELKVTSPSPSLPLMINSNSKVHQHREPLQQYLQKGPALSLGGIEFESTNTQQPFSSSTHNFLPSTREIPMDLSPWMIASSCRVSNNHHNLFYASSHQASQSTGGGGTSDLSVFEVQQL